MQTRKRPLRANALKPAAPIKPQALTPRQEPILSHLVSKVEVALAEIEAIQEARGHGIAKSRGRMALYPAE